jgi:hypothetical protein
MNRQITSPIEPASQSPGKSLPDVNYETYPFNTVLEMLEKTSNFSMFAVPVPGHLQRASLNAKNRADWFNLNGGYGLDLLSHVHRFESIVQMSGRGFKVAQTLGDATGQFRCLCLFSPPEFRWNPKQTPPPWIFDPWRGQHFVMKECELTFGGGYRCRFYGVGRTFPVSVEGRHVILFGGVANLVTGTGKFEGREGTLVCTGTLTPELGFLGNLNLRVRDDQRTLVSESELTPPDSLKDSDRENTFLEIHLAKKNKDVKTTFGPPSPDGQVSLITPAVMRSTEFSYVAGARGPRTHMSLRQVLGPMEAKVFFDLAAPPGTPDAPVPFTTQELYTFDGGGRATLGTVSCGVVEGQSFGLQFPAAPGQPGVRFAGFGPIQGGTGCFAGARGMLTVNSMIGIAPHAISLMHVLHLLDPHGRFRAGV